MHLLALLIATVLSSQFGALSNSAEFTVSPSTVHSDTVSKVDLKRTGGTGAWTTPKVAFSVENTLEGGETWTALTGTDPNWSIADVNFATIIDEEVGVTTIYVWVSADGSETSNTYLPAPAEIAVDDDYWWVELDPVDLDTKALTNVKVHAPKGGWDTTPAITLCITDDDTATAETQFTITAKSTLLDDEEYSFGAVDISDLELDTTKPLFAFVKLSIETANTEGWADGKFQIPVAAAEEKYTIAPTELPENLLPFFTSLTITPAEGVNLGNDITVKVDIAGESNAGALIKNVTLSGGDYVLTFTPAEFAAIKASPASSDTYEVSVAPAATTPVFWVITKTFALTAGPAYGAAPPEFQLKEWILNAQITLSQEDDWDGVHKVVISLAHDRTKAEATDVVVTTGTLAADNFIVALTAPAVALVNEANLPVTVFLYVVEDETDIDLPPTFITVVPNVPLFVIEPDTLTEADLADEQEFEVTPRANAGWTAGKMTITFSLDDEEPTDPARGNAIPFTFPLAAPSAGGQPWTVAAADLSTLAVTAETTDIYVWVANNEVYAEEYVKIPFTPTTTFTIPTTSVTFADGWKVEEIDVTPVPARNWAGLGNKLKFCYSVVAAPASNVAVPNITGEVTKTGSGESATYSIPEKLLAPFELTAADLPKRILVEITEDDWTTRLGTTAHIALVAGSEPEETTFTLTPNQINWAAEMKLLKTEIKPTPEAPEGWPTDPEDDTMKFEILNPAAATVEAVTGTVTIEVDEEEETVQWFIPKDTEISKFATTAPSADVLLTVKISIDDGETWITTAGAITIKKPEPEKPEAAMGVSPLLSLLAALVFLFVKLF